eukprot:scaffold434_cov186-Pinguiococcus_pyrenoidosus.AAC.93
MIYPNKNPSARVQFAAVRNTRRTLRRRSALWPCPTCSAPGVPPEGRSWRCEALASGSGARAPSFTDQLIELTAPRHSSEDDSPTAEAAQAASAAEEEEDAPESPRCALSNAIFRWFLPKPLFNAALCRFKRNVSENSQIPKGVDLPPERYRYRTEVELSVLVLNCARIPKETPEYGRRRGAQLRSGQRGELCSRGCGGGASAETSQTQSAESRGGTAARRPDSAGGAAAWRRNERECDRRRR